MTSPVGTDHNGVPTAGLSRGERDDHDPRGPSEGSVHHTGADVAGVPRVPGRGEGGEW